MYSWPLNFIIPYTKQRDMKKILEAKRWAMLSQTEVRYLLGMLTTMHLLTGISIVLSQIMIFYRVQNMLGNSEITHCVISCNTFHVFTSFMEICDENCSGHWQNRN